MNQTNEVLGNNRYTPDTFIFLAQYLIPHYAIHVWGIILGFHCNQHRCDTLIIWPDIRCNNSDDRHQPPSTECLMRFHMCHVMNHSPGPYTLNLKDSHTSAETVTYGGYGYYPSYVTHEFHRHCIKYKLSILYIFTLDQIASIVEAVFIVCHLILI